MKKNKITSRWFEENITTGDSWSKRGEVFTVRQGYFYRPSNSDPSDYAHRVAKMIEQELPEYRCQIEDFGDHWAPFKGGAGVRNQSHYWVKFTLIAKPVKVESSPESCLNPSQMGADGGAMINNWM